MASPDGLPPVGPPSGPPLRGRVTIRPVEGPAVELAVDERGHWAAPGPDDRGAVDGAAWWALVGLADCHAHLSGGQPGVAGGPDAPATFEGVQRNAWAQLGAGVFLVADKGGKNDVTLRLLDEPPPDRPDLTAAGQVITAPGGYFPGFAVEVDEAGLAAAVAERADTQGISWVKLIGDWPRRGVGAVPNFGEDALRKAVEVAHAGGCRVAIHACAPHTSTLAVAAGIDSVEHGLFLTDDDLVALGRRGGAWVPTVGAMEGVRDDLGAQSSGGRLFAEGLENVRGLLASAPSRGVTVLCGTDLQLDHGQVATDAVRLAAYGLPTEAVVRSVSTAAYEYLGRSDRGFEVGRPADVVFFDADPRLDITVLARPILAVRHGRVVVDRRR
jgi:imidazolonepropionase-like amidohydrolase